MSGETWKDVEGYEGLYQVSNFGRVKALYKELTVGNNGGTRIYPEAILALGNSVGYPKVELHKNSKGKSHKVHALVATAFLPNTLKKPCVNHKDGNKTNNHVSNLEWVTFSENLIHAIQAGLHKPVQCPQTRSDEDRRKISERRKLYWAEKRKSV